MYKDKFCIKDNILDCIEFVDLIVTMQCNEQEINEITVNRVFDELLTMHIENAREVLKQNMANILKEV